MIENSKDLRDFASILETAAISLQSAADAIDQMTMDIYALKSQVYNLSDRIDILEKNSCKNRDLKRQILTLLQDNLN